MNIRRIVGIAVLCLTLTSGTALASYQQSYDLTLNVNLAPSLLQFSGDTGSESFALQEGAHQTVTDSTGEEVDHYYIWINVNGQPVLAVDPFWASERDTVK